MMTKQAELKKQAYASNLKSRALSVLIYLIDRSNQDLTCFPAIPTMAGQMHISISTVKRALKELVDAGYIQKSARFREKNRGQSSNLYTLLFVEPTSTSKSNKSPATIHKNNRNIPVITETQRNDHEVEHITFETLSQQSMEQVQRKSDRIETGERVEKNAITQFNKPILSNHCTPVQLDCFSKNVLQPTPLINKFYGSALSHNLQFCEWTGEESNLIPP
jgi:DNA-binding transcriptional regulator YhcF (GntR family)